MVQRVAMKKSAPRNQPQRDAEDFGQQSDHTAESTEIREPLAGNISHGETVEILGCASTTEIPLKN